jgi:D-alanyl-D-alanine dipeptidase
MGKRTWWVAFGVGLWQVYSSPCRPAPGPDGRGRGASLVPATSVAPGIVVDLRYATTENVFRTRLYREPKCLLRRPVAERLARVQRSLEAEGLGLKVWDAYRPASVQRRMWQLVGGSRYLANPRRGSRHSRGAAVDVTLVDRDGKELAMPTGFDAFSRRASRAYRGGSPAARRNRDRLERAMRAQGFVPNPGEWWHFDDPDWRRYPLLDVPL